MKNEVTRKELEKFVSKMGACSDARGFLASFQTDDVRAIWATCEEPALMLWVVARIYRIKPETFHKIAWRFLTELPVTAEGGNAVTYLSNSSRAHYRVALRCYRQYVEGIVDADILRDQLEVLTVAKTARLDPVFDALVVAMSGSDLWLLNSSLVLGSEMGSDSIIYDRRAADILREELDADELMKHLRFAVDNEGIVA